MIDPAKQAEILRLFFTEKLSQREIASKGEVHRKSVKAIIDRREVHLKPKNSKNKITILDRYHQKIAELLKEDHQRSSVNILQKLRSLGYTGGVTTLRNYVRDQRIRPEPKAYLTLEFLPGQAAQVDWGDFGDYFRLGRKLWCFLMVLSYSRMLYIEFTHSACLESFLRCHERALQFFGGIPEEIWYDNLASAVAERKQKIIRFNPRFMAYCGHCYYKPVACNLGCGNEKGRVEDGVKYVRGNFWPGRSFNDIDDLNTQAQGWLNQFANRRTHAASRKIPELVLESKERCELLPLQSPYDTDEKRSVKVPPQFRVRFDSNEYSVPWRLVGRTLLLRANDQTIHFYLNTKRICSHKRCWQKGQSIINPAHQEGLLERKPGAQQSWDIKTVKSLGPNACRYLNLLGAQNRSINNELKNLMVLITVYGSQSVEEMMLTVLNNNVIGYEHLERLLHLKHNQSQPHPEPLKFQDPRLTLPPTVTDLKSYDALLFDKDDPS